MSRNRSTGTRMTGPNLCSVIITYAVLFTEKPSVLADEYNSCERQARSRQLDPLPCHFKPDANFCASPGSTYPWQSLIKFVNDNRGLMTRMYGDTQHGVLLRQEIESHKIRVSTAVARSLQLDQTEYAYPEAMPDLSVNPVLKPPDQGHNACPSRTEVLSPYWANTTRGDLVAVLNVYPFEQYLYFDKCTEEHRQMACREGCRCEQHFGLQRLLVFDPRNECRGIFADWFRFPSCCVCRCYDTPPEAATVQAGESGRTLSAAQSGPVEPTVEAPEPNTTDFNGGG